MQSTRLRTVRRVLLMASAAGIAMGCDGASAAPGILVPNPALAAAPEQKSSIVVRHDLSPNLSPNADVLDNRFTGVGQMAVQPDPSSTGLSMCSGTLINPRTVLFAAHCVNPRPASAYGSDPGGVPISFGFQANNLPALRQWLGLDGGMKHKTNEALALYNVEQVWYDPRSVASRSEGFLEADIALATLDTPAFNIPTWTLLFSPLTAETHALIMGYGRSGTSATGATGIDFRRRAAENMLSVLGSFTDRDRALYGSDPGLPQNLYMLSFNDPDPAYDPSRGKFDFGIFGGKALPNEGITAGGDSGGPLVVDQKFTKPVVVGVLSGGARFFADQPLATYGTHSFYQPLFLFWDQIVANNSYIYAGNVAGSRDWTDPSHWLQMMDPNYAVERQGGLANDLPDTPALGVTGNSPKFGSICFGASCINLATGGAPAATGSGPALQVAGGPGSINFVPDNVTNSPARGTRSRYYDVTLAAAGTTTLHSAVTIDRFNISGDATLDVKSSGSLTVLGDFTQARGWTHVDGLLRAGESLLISGFLTGSGTIDPTFLTVVGGIVAPGGAGEIGTLTIKGDVVLASGSALFVDLMAGASDMLLVQGDAANAGILSLGGSLVFNRAQGGPAPRDGDTFVVAAAAGGVQGTFADVRTVQSVLRPNLIYGGNVVTAELDAGSLAQFVTRTNPRAVAFATSLDALRERSYSRLYGLYGAIDLMDEQTLTHTLSALAPDIAHQAVALQNWQSKLMLGSITDRLSQLGSNELNGRISLTGPPQAMFGNSNAGAGAAKAGPRRLATGLVPSGPAAAKLPDGVSGFLSAGVLENGSSYGDERANARAGQFSRHVGMGLEIAVTDAFTLGTAWGYADGYSAPKTAQARADSQASQAAFYGTYRFGEGIYLAGLAAADRSRTSVQRRANTGEAMFNLTGATSASHYNLVAEGGLNLPVARGLILTPRTSLGYARYELAGFREAGGEPALQIDTLELKSLESRVGAKLAGSTALGTRLSLAPQFQADWVNVISGSNDGMSVRFANADGEAFKLPPASGDRSWAEVKAGLKLTAGKIGVGAGLHTSIGRSNVADERAVLDFAVRF